MNKFFILTTVFALSLSVAKAQSFELKNSGTNFILYNVSVPQNNETIAFAGGSQYTDDTAAGVIVRTTDAGETWETVYEGDNIQTLDFVTPLKGFAGGYAPTLKLTEDGGQNWQEVNVGSNVYVFFVVKFFDENKGLILYLTQDYEMEVRTTDDGGQTWNLSQNPPQHGIMSIDYADENTLFAVGYSGSVYRSVDGGNNWELIQSSGMSINLGVNFKDAQNGVYSGEEGDLYVTHDGGNSWSNPLFTGYHHFYGLKYTGQKIIAVGTDMDVYVSGDNGETFEFAYDGAGDDQLYSIALFADNSGLITGSGGKIIKFTNLILNTENQINNQLTLYPNPTLNTLNIRNQFPIDEIQIFDMSGKSVLTQKNLGQEAQINVRHLQKGVYIIKINSRGEIKTHKFSKK